MNNIETMMPVFIACFFAFGILELILSSVWSKFYFTFGLPLLSKRIHFDGEVNPEDIDLNSLERNFSSEMGRDIVFKSIDNRNIGFREKHFQFRMFAYQPIMHGQIEIDNEFRVVKVRGLANWLVIGIPIVLILVLGNFYSWGTSVEDIVFLIFFPLLALIPFIIIYFIQGAKYKKIAKAVEQMIKERNIIQ